MIIGTAHFDNLLSAIRYYKSYGLARADVERIIKKGEIHLGPPTITPDRHKAGDKVMLSKQEGRFFIQTAE